MGKMYTIEIIYPKVMSITCFSHALDLVGSKFVFSSLDKLTKHWFMIVQHSSKAKLCRLVPEIIFIC